MEKYFTQSEREPELKELPVHDQEGVERYSQQYGFRESRVSELPALTHFHLDSEQGSVDLFEMMGLDPKEVSVHYVSTREPAVFSPNTESVFTYRPSSPMRLLIQVHELAHAQQNDEWPLKGLRHRVPTNEVFTAWTALRESGFDIDLPEETYEKLTELHKRFIAILRVRQELNDPEMQKEEFQETMNAYRTLAEHEPALAKIGSLEEIFSEQDAHARTNTVMERLEEALGVPLDFSNREDFPLQDSDKTDASIYERAYAVLSRRKESNACSRGVPIAEHCRRIGIPLKHSLPEELQEYFDDAHTQEALTKVRMKMKGYV